MEYASGSIQVPLSNWGKVNSAPPKRFHFPRNPSWYAGATGHPLSSSHRHGRRRFKMAACGRYKDFLRYFKNPLPRRILYRHHLKDSGGNCPIPSPCSSYERPPPLHLPKLRSELLSRSRSGGPQRRLPLLRARVHCDPSRLLRALPHDSGYRRGGEE